MKDNTQHKLIIAGLGPGNPDLITLEALNSAKNSDIIIVPRSKPDVKGIAEKIIGQFLPDKEFLAINFPMITDERKRSQIILEQLIHTKSQWQNANVIFFPVIGDSVLFSTGAYLLEQMRKILPGLDVEFIPGISAHSLASTCAKKFLAMKNEILSIIPGTAEPEKIIHALKCSDITAIYKPKAIKNIHDVINPDDFTKILRVDFAGIPEREKIIHGSQALENITEYLSILLLWK